MFGIIRAALAKLASSAHFAVCAGANYTDAMPVAARRVVCGNGTNPSKSERPAYWDNCGVQLRCFAE
jgi:hypothetical protein